MSPNNAQYLIRGARIVQPTRVEAADLVIENGVIAYLGEPVAEPAGASVIRADGCYVVPGFIDLHCHGGSGLDLTEGWFDPATRAFDASASRYEEGLPRLMSALAAGGTTRVVLATIAAPESKLTAALGHLGRYIARQRSGQETGAGAVLHGAFVEGTFIHNPAFAGAQNPAYFSEPSVEVFDRLNAAAEGTVCYVNVAPDWGRSAISLTAELVRRGILVGAGHTQATGHQYLDAVRAGLRVAIHFTNGPTGTSFKPFDGGGVLQTVLRTRDVFAELICDGYHINPSYVMDIIHRKGIDRIVAISDAMFVADLPGIETFVVGGVRGQVSPNGRYLSVADNPASLFGSVIRMRDAFGNLLTWLTRPMRGIWREVHPPMDLDDALVAVSQMCSANPARLLGLYEPASRRLGQDLSACTGGIEIGKRADLAIVRLAGDPERFDLDIVHTFVGGQPFSREPSASGQIV